MKLSALVPVLLVALLLLAGVATALPTTGAAADITSNGFNTTITGITGDSVWVYWGDYSGKENWITPNVTAVAGTATVQLIGAPVYGGETIVFQACDSTGCGNEVSVTLAAITPIPIYTFGQPIRNITNSRFNPQIIQNSLLSVYTMVAPAVIMFGVAFLFFAFGIWMRTKSVRMMMILGLLIYPFIYLANAGLHLGIPLIAQSIAVGLFAAALAGLLVSWMRK